MAEVIFITPALENSIAQESLGTLLLATILRRSGIESEVFPLAAFGDVEKLPAFLDAAIDAVLQRGAKIVSFYTRCDTYHIMIKIAERIKEASDAYIVFGGPQSDIVAQETLSRIPWVDYICQGEGDCTIVPFFSSLLRGTPDLSIPGLVYRSGSKLLHNPRPPFIDDLDVLPDIDYSFVESRGLVSAARRLHIDVGRGCPFGCTFCSTKTFWGRKYRIKSPERICGEIRSAHEAYGITRFAFTHDMLTFKRSHILTLCSLLKELDFAADWTCSARVDCVDKGMIDEMVSCGMSHIYFGIETGSAHMQKLINKNLNLEPAFDLLSYIQNKGVNITASFIYGFPEETEGDVSHTIALIGKLAKLKKVNVQTHLCTFLPGTELTQRYRDQFTSTIQAAGAAGKNALAECQDLFEEHPGLFTQFYEYQTPLREKLKYFKVFIGVWFAMQPVYQFFSERYPSDELIMMYDDFVEANRDMLIHTEALPTEQSIRAIVQEDRFAQRFDAGCLREIIDDCYRMACAPYSDTLSTTGTDVQIYCFSPKQFERGSSIREYEKKQHLAVYTRSPEGIVSIRQKACNTNI